MRAISFYDSIREIFKVPLTTVIQMLVYEDCTSNNEVWLKLICQTSVELSLVSCKPRFISTNASDRNHAMSKFHMYPYKGEHICMTIWRIRKEKQFYQQNLGLLEWFQDIRDGTLKGHWDQRESIQGLVHSPARTLKKYQHFMCELRFWRWHLRGSNNYISPFLLYPLSLTVIVHACIFPAATYEVHIRMNWYCAQ